MNLQVRELDEPAGAAAEVHAPPKVFVRALTTPPGAPWEQARAARLDAQHGAPLPISELMHQVRRLDRWGPGRSGQFAAFYVRVREYREPFETPVEVDGQTVRVRFGTPTQDVRRLQAAGAVLFALVLSGAVMGAGAVLALRARGEASTQLAADEQLARTRLAAAQAFRDRSNQASDLRSLVGQARPLGEVVADLTWVATSKTPEARVVGIHWERGLLAVEARGEQPPFLAADRPLERSGKPLRPGVWLWAVGRAQDMARARAVAAEMRP
jgi:hypothetical protein